MKSSVAVVVVLVAVATGRAGAAGPGLAFTTQTSYAGAVDRICAGALLFEHAHTIGTRAGALAVSDDIRASGLRRLGRVAAVPEPAATTKLIDRWLTLQRRLIGMYATNYLRIWLLIERSNTPQQRRALPGRLEPLIRQPDPLKRRASALERTLSLPDCTGGGTE